jgi:hypothetical protein
MAEHHHEKEHPEGKGVNLIGDSEELITMLFDNPEERTWAVEEMANGGPGHKQVLNALLLQRLSKLLKEIERSTGTSFDLQDGREVSIEKNGDKILIPIKMPMNTGVNVNNDDIAAAIVNAPAHEVLLYAICLQVIEWGIKVNAAI